LYHRITRPGDPFDPPVAVPQTRFDRHLAGLLDAGYVCISLNHLIAHIRHGQPLPPRSFVITLDDGFLDTYRRAWPVLRRRGCTATVFLVADRIGQTSRWMQDEPSGPQLLMRADQIRDMQASGIDFGSHGCTHVPLTELDAPGLADELVRSRERLSELLGREVSTLAYPHGRFDARVRRAAEQAGYRAAVSVIAGWNHRATDLMVLRRIVVSGRDTETALLAKVILGEHRIRWRYLVRNLAREGMRRWSP